MALQPTASKTDLLLQCQRPFDPVTVIEPGEASEAARYGSAFHWLLAGLFLGRPGDPAEALARYNMTGRSTPEALRIHVEDAEAELRRWLTGDNPWGAKLKVRGVEGPLAFNIRPDGAHAVVGTTLEESDHTYDMQGRMMAGTPDLIAQAGEIRVVIDHKTGHDMAYSRPVKMGQMRTLALATRANAVAIFDAPPGRLPMVHVDPIDRATKRKHAADLLKALGRVGDGTLKPGPECRWCPAREDCPARASDVIQAAQALLPKANLAVRGGGGALTVKKAGELHQMMADFDRLKAMAKDEIRALVEAGEEITRPDGKRLAIVVKSVERISKKSILALPNGAAELERLRSIGALTETEQEELRAI